jgi:hypothetical protein
LANLPLAALLDEDLGSFGKIAIAKKRCVRTAKQATWDIEGLQVES